MHGLLRNGLQAVSVHRSRIQLEFMQPGQPKVADAYASSMTRLLRSRGSCCGLPTVCSPLEHFPAAVGILGFSRALRAPSVRPEQPPFSVANRLIASPLSLSLPSLVAPLRDLGDSDGETIFYCTGRERSESIGRPLIGIPVGDWKPLLEDFCYVSAAE